MAYSERERKFTSAKNYTILKNKIIIIYTINSLLVMFLRTLDLLTYGRTRLDMIINCVLYGMTCD